MAVVPQKYVLEQNFQLLTPLKFGSPVFWVLTEMQNWCQPLQKMGKMAIEPQKHILQQNFQLPTPLKFGSPVFWVLMKTQNWCRPLQKMGKMAVAPQKHILEQNFQLPTPIKFGSPVFWVLTETQNCCRPLKKMGKMAIVPQKHILEQNFQLPTPPKVWVSPWKCPRARAFILPHESPMCSFTLPNIWKLNVCTVTVYMETVYNSSSSTNLTKNLNKNREKSIILNFTFRSRLCAVCNLFVFW